MKIYIAGPITGKLEYKKEFKSRESKLRSMGHIVVSPAYLPDGLKEYMQICKAMIDQVDAVYFMTGWENSVGATEEREYALKKNKKLIFEDEIEGIKKSEDYWHREAIKWAARLGESKIKFRYLLNQFGIPEKDFRDDELEKFLYGSRHLY